MQTAPCVLFTTGTLPATKGEGAFVWQDTKGAQSCCDSNRDALFAQNLLRTVCVT